MKNTCLMNICMYVNCCLLNGIQYWNPSEMNFVNKYEIDNSTWTQIPSFVQQFKFIKYSCYSFFPLTTFS